MQRNSPFYLTENVEEKIKDMFKEDRKKLVPFYAIINFEISRELSKLMIFNIEAFQLARYPALNAFLQAVSPEDFSTTADALFRS